MCLVRITKHLSRKVRPVQSPSLSQQPQNCLLVYDFEGESMIKQVGWEVRGFYLSPESTRQKQKGWVGK